MRTARRPKLPSSKSEAIRAVNGRADRADAEDSRQRNGTGEDADEQQLGVAEEEVKDLANDAEGG